MYIFQNGQTHRNGQPVICLFNTQSYDRKSPSQIPYQPNWCSSQRLWTSEQHCAVASSAGQPDTYKCDDSQVSSKVYNRLRLKKINAIKSLCKLVLVNEHILNSNELIKELISSTQEGFERQLSQDAAQLILESDDYKSSKTVFQKFALFLDKATCEQLEIQYEDAYIPQHTEALKDRIQDTISEIRACGWIWKNNDPYLSAPPPGQDSLVPKLRLFDSNISHTNETAVTGQATSSQIPNTSTGYSSHTHPPTGSTLGQKVNHLFSNNIVDDPATIQSIDGYSQNTISSSTGSFEASQDEYDVSSYQPCDPCESSKDAPGGTVIIFATSKPEQGTVFLNLKSSLEHMVDSAMGWVSGTLRANSNDKDSDSEDDKGGMASEAARVQQRNNLLKDDSAPQGSVAWNWGNLVEGNAASNDSGTSAACFTNDSDGDGSTVRKQEVGDLGGYEQVSEVHESQESERQSHWQRDVKKQAAQIVANLAPLQVQQAVQVQLDAYFADISTFDGMDLEEVLHVHALFDRYVMKQKGKVMKVKRKRARALRRLGMLERLVSYPPQQQRVLVQHSIDRRMYQPTQKQMQEVRREQREWIRRHSQHLVIDCSYLHRESKPWEISGVVSQTQMLLAANYNADLDNAFQLVYTSYYGDVAKYGSARNIGTSVITDSRHVTEVYPKDKIIYLSPDADEVLECVDASNIYVIGGIIDQQQCKNQSLISAELHGVQVRRLPIKEHVVGEAYPQDSQWNVLSLKETGEVLIEHRAAGSWEEALKKLAPRRNSVQQEEHDNLTQAAHASESGSSTTEKLQGSQEEAEQQTIDGHHTWNQYETPNHEASVTNEVVQDNSWFAGLEGGSSAQSCGQHVQQLDVDVDVDMSSYGGGVSVSGVVDAEVRVVVQDEESSPLNFARTPRNSRQGFSRQESGDLVSP